MEGDSYKSQDYTIRRRGTGRHYYHTTNWIETYDARFQTIDPNNTNNCCVWRQADLIKFHACFYQSWKYEDKWQKWFMGPDEYWRFLNNTCRKNGTVPVYAHHQYAIIINRYKWTKYKSSTIYRDYGSIIMMLTGKRQGHIRRYYVNAPWDLIGSFPYTNGPHPDLPNVMPLLQDSLDDDVQVFLKNLTEKYNT